MARFRVTAEALRAARGTVRCGRCGSAFDAIARLSDTLPPVAPVPPPPVAIDVQDGLEMSATGEAAGAATDYHFSATDLDQVFIDQRDWQQHFGVAPEQALAEGPPTLLVDEEQALEDITMEGEKIVVESGSDLEEQLGETLADEDYEEDKAVEPAAAHGDLDSTDRFETLKYVPEAAALEDEPADEDTPLRLRALTIDAPEAPGEAAEALPAVVAASRAAVEPAAEPATPPLAVPADGEGADGYSAPVAPAVETREAAEPAPALVYLEPQEDADRQVLAWTLGALLLAVMLAMQVIHHFRQDLVRHPQVGPPLAALYERLGVELSPNWDPRAFELRQWGGQASDAAAGLLSVHASITNRAQFAQPLPLLRVEIQDRFGGTVATRDFEPREYLKDPAMATRLLAPGAGTEASLELVDPGTDAVGYRLDVCLRESARLLRCAQGPG
jgi:predicted Zn finger-like uncharacterized protein